MFQNTKLMKSNYGYTNNKNYALKIMIYFFNTERIRIYVSSNFQQK